MSSRAGRGRLIIDQGQLDPPFGVTMDLDDAPRFVDMGPHEIQRTTRVADLDGDRTVGFADLTHLLAARGPRP